MVTNLLCFILFLFFVIVYIIYGMQCVGWDTKFEKSQDVDWWVLDILPAGIPWLSDQIHYRYFDSAMEKDGATVLFIFQ